MLVYEKKVDGVRHLFGTINNVPSDSDNQLVYKDADGDAVEPSLSYQYFDNGQGGITMVDAEGVETFLGVNIKKANNDIVNIIPGGSYTPATKVLKSIAFTKAPTKTEYVAGDTIVTTGCQVTATWATGETSKVTTSCSFTPTEALTVEDTVITASYTYDGVTKTATTPITVEAAPEPPADDNGEGQ